MPSISMMSQQGFIGSIVLLIMLAILTSTFYANAFNTVDPSWFNKHQVDSENLVIHRIIDSNINGFYHNAMFLTRNSVVYVSSSGLQGSIFSSLNKVSPLTFQNNIRLFHFVNSIILSCILVAFIAFAMNEFGLVVATSLFFGVLLSDWIVVFGRNLYWILWSMYLPLLIVLVFSRRLFDKKERGVENIFVPFVYVSILFRSLSGYEYISTILISMVVPFVYFGVIYRDVERALRLILLTGCVGVLGFITALVVHLLQLSLHYGNFELAYDKILDTVLKRTHGEPLSVDPVYANSLNANVYEVLVSYFNGYYHYFGQFGMQMKYLILVFLVLSLFNLVLNKKERMISLALFYSLIFSILAPLSWFILAKGHSYIHTHMNHLLWNIPFNLVGFIVVGCFVQFVARQLYLSFTKSLP